jgi:hypothetical protein
MTFGAALDRHLAAITQRDLDTYLTTVHDGVSVILPDGRGLVAAA